MIQEYLVEDVTLGESQKGAYGNYYTGSVKVHGHPVRILVSEKNVKRFKLDVKKGEKAYLVMEVDSHFGDSFKLPSEIEILKYRMSKQENLINDLIQKNGLKWKD